MPTNDDVIAALKKVKFPGLSRDIVSFGFVSDVKIDGGTVSMTIRFQTENPAVGQQISRDAEAAVKTLAGVTDVQIHLDVAPRQQGGTAALPNMGASPRILEGVTYKIAVASGKGGVG